MRADSATTISCMFEAREASDVHTLALPLAYIYARNVLVLYRSRPDKPAVRRFLTWARQRYKNVYFIAGGGTDLLSPGVGAEIVDSERFQVPEYEKTAYDAYPRSAVLKPFDFTIYRLTEASATTAPHSLDVGGADDLHLVDFHPKERIGGGDLTFRWTQDSSHLLMGVPSGSKELVLRLSSGRPPGTAPPARVGLPRGTRARHRGADGRVPRLHLSDSWASRVGAGATRHTARDSDSELNVDTP